MVARATHARGGHEHARYVQGDFPRSLGLLHDLPHDDPREPSKRDAQRFRDMLRHDRHGRYWDQAWG
jgi:hypothetical protein